MHGMQGNNQARRDTNRQPSRITGREKLHKSLTEVYQYRSSGEISAWQTSCRSYNNPCLSGKLLLVLVSKLGVASRYMHNYINAANQVYYYCLKSHNYNYSSDFKYFIMTFNRLK